MSRDQHLPLFYFTGKGAVYSFDPVGSYQRDTYKAGGSASAMLQPLLDNQVRMSPVSKVIISREGGVKELAQGGLLVAAVIVVQKQNLFSWESNTITISCLIAFKEYNFFMTSYPHTHWSSCCQAYFIEHLNISYLHLFLFILSRLASRTCLVWSTCLSPRIRPSSWSKTSSSRQQRGTCTPVTLFRSVSSPRRVSRRK